MINFFKKIYNYCCKCDIYKEDYSEYVEIIDNKLRTQILKEDNSISSSRHRTLSSFDEIKPTNTEIIIHKFTQNLSI